MPTLRISPEKVCFIVVKARELDVKVAPEWMDDGSNPTDDQMAQILEDYADDATLDELKSYMQALKEDELEDLLALTWLGRGDYTLADWEDLMSEVQDVRDRRTVDYLIGTPCLPITWRTVCPNSACPAPSSSWAGCRLARVQWADRARAPFQAPHLQVHGGGGA